MLTRTGKSTRCGASGHRVHPTEAQAIDRGHQRTQKLILGSLNRIKAWGPAGFGQRGSL